MKQASYDLLSFKFSICVYVLGHAFCNIDLWQHYCSIHIMVKSRKSIKWFQTIITTKRRRFLICIKRNLWSVKYWSSKLWYFIAKLYWELLVKVYKCRYLLQELYIILCIHIGTMRLTMSPQPFSAARCKQLMLSCIKVIKRNKQLIILCINDNKTIIKSLPYSLSPHWHHALIKY